MMADKAAPTWRNRIVGHGDEDPTQLLANPRNWRVHPKGQQDALTGALDQVGWVQQVVVNTTTGHMVDGHLRVEMALSRGEPAVPVVYVELTPEEEGLVLASLDPIGAMAATDDEKLRQLLAEVSFDSRALEQAISELAPAQPAAGLTDPDDVPEPGDDMGIVRGDVFALGDHRLMCGDSTSMADLGRLYSGKVGCVLTDPPYGINLDTDYANSGGMRGRTYRAVIGDDQPFDASALSSLFASVDEQFWFGADYYRRTLPYDDLAGSWLVWDKRDEDPDDPASNWDDALGSTFELVWSRQRHKRLLMRYRWTNWTSHSNDGHRREHPTEKPINLLVDILDRWAPKGCIVADPFAGSGTTLMAADRSGRSCYAMEIDPRYCAVIVRRWEGVTGQKAVKLDSEDA